MAKAFKTSTVKDGQVTPTVLGGLVHELTSKFNAVDGFAQEVISSAEGQGSTGAKTHLQSALSAMGALIKHLQFFAQHQSYEESTFSLGELLKELMEELSKTYPSLSVEAVSYPGLDVIVESDRLLWKQALLPILMNAIESYASQDKATVSVDFHIERKDQSLRVSIVDHGEGIAEAHLPHVFDPFYTNKGSYRLSKQQTTFAESKTSHHGLGLSIARQIVEALGGKIIITSKPKQGTDVTLMFE